MSVRLALRPATATSEILRDRNPPKADISDGRLLDFLSKDTKFIEVALAAPAFAIAIGKAVNLISDAFGLRAAARSAWIKYNEQDRIERWGQLQPAPKFLVGDVFPIPENFVVSQRH